MNFSQIGNYIHFSYSNYRQAGLARSIKNRSTNQRATLDRYLKAIPVSSGMPEVETRHLEKAIGAIRKQYSVGEVGRATYGSIQSSIAKLLQATASAITVDDIDWNTATIKPGAVERVTSSIDMSQVVIDGLRSLRTVKYSQLGKSEQGGVNIANISKHIQFIQNGINTLTDATTVKRLNDKLQVIREALKVLEIDIEKSGRVQVSQLFIKKALGETTESTSLLRELELLARDVFTATSLADIEGKLAEMIATAALQQVTATGTDAIEDLLGDFITKASSGTEIIASSNFKNGLDLDQILAGKKKTWKSSNSGNTYTLTHSVKGKSDIVAYLQDSLGQPLRRLDASVKNYNLKARGNQMHLNNINAVSKTNLIYLFQKQGEMLNHYLNQTARPSDPTGQQKISAPPASIVAEANLIMQKAVLLLGIQGGGLRTDLLSGKAQDYFIQMDKATSGGKGVRVMSMSTLWNRLIYLIKTQRFENVAEVTGIDQSTTWKNEYSNTVNERITGLLVEVRRQPVSAYIRKSAIQQLMRT